MKNYFIQTVLCDQWLCGIIKRIIVIKESALKTILFIYIYVYIQTFLYDKISLYNWKYNESNEKFSIFH